VDARFLSASRKFDLDSEILNNCNNGTQDQSTADESRAFGSCGSSAFAFKRCFTAGEKEMVQSSARYAGEMT
jgi:hypothetical protein